MRKRGAFAAGAILLVLGILVVRPAFAYMCCDPWGAVGYSAFVQAGSQVVRAISRSMIELTLTIERKIVKSWESGFGNYSSEVGKQTASQKTFAEGRVAVDAQMYMTERAAEASIDATPAAQQAISITSAMLMSEQSSITKQKLQALDLAYAADFFSIKSPNPALVLERHVKYCSGDDVEKERCSPAAFASMQNADLNVATILNPGEGQYETLSEEEVAAANVFVRNTTNPWPTMRLQGNEDVKVAESMMLADQAALSVSAHSLNAAIAHRMKRR